MKMFWMKQDRFIITRREVFLAFNLSVVLAALFYIAWAGAQSRKYINRDVVCIMPVINDNAYYFGPEDIQAIEDSYFDGLTAAESFDNIMVTAGETKVFAGVATADRNYFYIHHIPFINGVPWTKEQENERVVVLSESLAWMLFGDTKSAGLTVYLNDEPYTVAGVAAQGTVTKNNGFAWIPPPENDRIYASTLYIKPACYNWLDARLSAEYLLNEMNRNMRHYRITDINTYTDSIVLRGQILLFLLVLYIDVLVIIYLYRLSRTMFMQENGRFAALIITAVVITVVVFITNRASFSLWVPAFAGEGAKAYAQVIFNAGLLAPREYLSYNLSVLYDLNLFANIAFAAGFIGLTQFAFLLPARSSYGQ